MKNTIKTFFLKIWSKLMVTILGILLYFIAIRLNEDIKGLLINIAASLISIPIIFIAYELWDEKTHRALNKSVYSYVENEMSQAMLEIRKTMEMLLRGYTVYFDYNDIVIDDSDYENQTLKMNDLAKVHFDEDGNPYQLKYQLEHIDELEEDVFDLYELGKDTVGSFMSEVRYLGYQIFDINLENIIEGLNELLNNFFIMGRMNDKENLIIIHLLEAIKMLNSFVSYNKEKLFLRSSINIQGFKYKTEIINNSSVGKMKLYSLYYSEEEYVTEENSADDKEYYEQLLEKKVFIDVPEDKLLSVYVINPDYYIMFGDLITEVLSCIKKWRTTSAGSIVTDYSNGWIGPL